MGAISLRLPSTNFRKGALKVSKRSPLHSPKLVSDKAASVKEDRNSEFTCLPVIVEFRRLLQSSKCKTVDVVPGVSNTELLHTVVGLYDTCLPDITPQVLYATVTGKGAKTLILVRNTKDVARDLHSRLKRKEDSVIKNNCEEATEHSNNGIPRQNGDSALSSSWCSQQTGKNKEVVAEEEENLSSSKQQLDIPGQNVDSTVPPPRSSPKTGREEDINDVVAVEEEEENAASSKQQLCHSTSDQNDATSVIDTERIPLLKLLDGEPGCPKAGEGDSTQGCHDDEDASWDAVQGRHDNEDAVEDGVDKEDVLEEEDARKVFADVFSDSESDEDESDDEDEDEDFSKGINEYLKLVKQRRERQDELSSDASQESLEATIGIESRIVACATWEKSHIRPGEKIIQIDLVAVRKRYRKSGIGRYLLRQMKDVSIVGPHDSLVVYADHSAVDFFALHGFSDDIVLNSKYSDLADNWTNCTLMCFIPPFVGQTIFNDTDMTLDLKAMELELQKWTERSREAYQGQVACIMKFRHEIISLRALVSSQKNLISSLTEELGTLQRDKLMLEKSNLEHKIAAIKAGYYRRHQSDIAANGRSDGTHSGDKPDGGDISESSEGDNKCAAAKSDDDDDDDDVNDDDDEVGVDDDDGENEADDEDEADGSVDSDDEIDTDVLIQALEAEAYGYRERGTDVASCTKSLEFAAKFEAEMMDKPLPGHRCTVTQVTMEKLCGSIKELHEIRLRQLGDAWLATNLYFCGSLSRPDRIPKILAQGFSEEDFTCGDYGVGLYFSEYPGTAAQFSAIGKMLVVKVGLGRTETILKKDRSRVTAPIGIDSVLTPGRLFRGSSSASDHTGYVSSTLISDCKEYVVFDPLQAVPVCLIEYVTAAKTGGSSVRL